MALSFFREFMGESTIAGLVGLVCTVETRASLGSLLARKIAQAVVFSLSTSRAVVEGWKVLAEMKRRVTIVMFGKEVAPRPPNWVIGIDILRVLRKLY